MKVKKFYLIMSLLMVATMMFAVPAKRGLWKMLRLSDGTEVKAQLSGDERVHFWVSENGQRYVEQGEVYVPVSVEEIQARAMKSSKARRNISHRLKSPFKAEMGDRTHYLGTKKGLVILAQFTDVKFKTANNLAKYKRIMNEAGYNVGSFRGSVSDYFKDQSDGQFELDFDVVGPYTLSKSQSYYGKNLSNGDDQHAEEMVKEACVKASADVNFADYDWDGDGEVDQIFVLYAGEGEADGGPASSVWPHMYYLAAADCDLTYNGVRLNTYACSNEIKPDGTIEGIGCFCHEFSHCMGFPDFYDTSYSGWFGMSDFDLMCGGSYNGSTFCPAGYTAHEKMMCGWQEPVVLSDKDTVITNLKPMSEHGETFIIYNDAHPDEYYMIENRQKNGWDTSYPAKGLMISHVDFDKNIWEYNCPNTKITRSSVEYTEYGYPLNDHQRMTIFHADNDDDSSYWSSYSGSGYYTKETLSTDLYPYSKKDSLTATSTPAATLYNKNSEGKKVMKGAILKIKQNSDGTMGFTYRAAGNGGGSGDDPVQPSGDYIFYESFDQCKGTGGNDDLWSGKIANKTFNPDNDGWTANGGKANGGDACAKFGTSSVVGSVTTPSFVVNGEATLTFKAGAWDSSKDGTDLSLESDEADIEPNTFTIEKGAWTNCSATIEANGSMQITFTPFLRFFLDEVLVVAKQTDGISNVFRLNEQKSDRRIFDLSGRCVGTDFSSLNHGIYIINGKKVKK